MKKFALLLALSASSWLLLAGRELDFAAQEQAGQPASDVSAKEARWSGIVQSNNKEKSTLIVRRRDGDLLKTIHYDDSTKWVSQEHGKKANDIEASKVKEGDRVICVGWEDKQGFHAALISKRLTPR